MINLERSKDCNGKKGQWHWHEKGITIRCPECNKLSTLDHEVNNDGVVIPSVDCPHCSFHDMIYLLKYTDYDLKPCPFCGSIARLKFVGGTKYWIVECGEDGGHMCKVVPKTEHGFFQRTKGEAIEDWNRRV